uniref:Uncharacterized protein n=1 Tax=Bacteriophage sp. TaxID=38018 RepID=A0A8D9PF02_9VIRU|nr:MAG TPA: hypothetical protein [Bacteriophage sp.]
MDHDTNNHIYTKPLNGQKHLQLLLALSFI